ncbi:beta-lactamase family protein [Streptomyces sp. NBC_00249]|uniref:serine hydrolase domain-containing protein n=1 Tax=Streptomyces sp. NBC_00249 TaxID=2975690 RepID=UPI002252758E|nr:serine hydrolase domain-containing protein [Streptomyces sp. NBC_00249]MCX5199574.1 beta-lactamase family protein [Streptomyces sp. NBC_00249]
MSHNTLAEFVGAAAAKAGVPGVAVGVWADGREVFACHGVTSVDNPLPVDRDTMFTLGSVTKTVTATALMRLVADGRVDLDAPVRRYVPELVLPDEGAAAGITVLNLLNHTAGLDWNLVADTGAGDDALAAFVAGMAGLPMIGEPGARASYSQAGFNLAGRILENVTGLTYERAVASLVLAPLGLTNSVFGPAEAITRRFSVGHDTGKDGVLTVAREWAGSRANNPGGGLASSVADQLRWARFHLGDGRAEGGERLLPAGLLERMKEPTVQLRGSSLGDAFGVCWFLRDVDGVRTVGHGGSGIGQFAELLTVPERDFAVVVMSNAGPDSGLLLNRAVVRWALEHYLGVVDADPEPLPYDHGRALEAAGDYEVDAMTVTIATDGQALTLGVVIKPEVRAASGTELPPDLAPAPLGLLPGDGDEYIVTGGGLAGQRGFFTRDAAGAIIGADLAGRLFTRVRAERGTPLDLK